MQVIFIGYFPTSFPIYRYLNKHEKIAGVFLQNEAYSKKIRQNLEQQFNTTFFLNKMQRFPSIGAEMIFL